MKVEWLPLGSSQNETLGVHNALMATNTAGGVIFRSLTVAGRPQERKEITEALVFIPKAIVVKNDEDHWEIKSDR